MLLECFEKSAELAVTPLARLKTGPRVLRRPVLVKLAEAMAVSPKKASPADFGL